MKSLTKIIFFIFTLMSFAGNLPAQDDNSSKIVFSVLDSQGKAVSGLTKEDISIFVGKSLPKVKALEKETEKSLEIVLMIDTSISQERVLPLTKKLATALINSIPDAKKDSIALEAFSGITETSTALTKDFESIKRKIQDLKINFPKGYVGGGLVIGTMSPGYKVASGSTSIWDNLAAATEKSFSSANDTKKILVLFSDGVDTFSRKKSKDVIGILAKNNVRVFAIGIGDKNYAGIDKSKLNSVSEDTGGKAFFPNTV